MKFPIGSACVLALTLLACGHTESEPPKPEPAVVLTRGLPDGRLEVLEGGTGELLGTLYDPVDERTLEVSSMDWTPTSCLAPDAATLATVRGDEPVRLWDVATLEERTRFERPRGVVVELWFSPSGRFLAAVGSTSKGRKIDVFEIWDTAPE